MMGRRSEEEEESLVVPVPVIANDIAVTVDDVSLWTNCGGCADLGLENPEPFVNKTAKKHTSDLYIPPRTNLSIISPLS